MTVTLWDLTVANIFGFFLISSFGADDFRATGPGIRKDDGTSPPPVSSLWLQSGVKQLRARSQAAFARTAAAAEMSTLLAWCSKERAAASDHAAAAAAADMSSEIMMAAVGVEFGKPLVSVAARLPCSILNG